MSERTIVTCDKCSREIGFTEQFVNLGTYGAHLHYSCWSLMSAIELTSILDIEGKVMKAGDWQNANKIGSYARKLVKIQTTNNYGKS